MLRLLPAKLNVCFEKCYFIIIDDFNYLDSAQMTHFCLYIGIEFQDN